MPVRVRQQQDRLLRMVHKFMGQVGLVVRDQSDAIRSGISFAETTTNSSQATPSPKVIFPIFPRGIVLRTVAP